MLMDMGEVNAFLEGVVMRREQTLNDSLYITHTGAIWTNLATWSPDKLPKSATQVSLLDHSKSTLKDEAKSRDEVLADILAFQRSMHNEVSKLDKPR